MYLVHIPTGLAAPLGRRMGWGWYIRDEAKATLGNTVDLLFDVLEREHDYGGGRQDDFAIALEDAEGASMATGNWQYGPSRDDELIQLVMGRPHNVEIESPRSAPNNERST